MLKVAAPCGGVFAAAMPLHTRRRQRRLYPAPQAARSLRFRQPDRLQNAQDGFGVDLVYRQIADGGAIIDLFDLPALQAPLAAAEQGHPPLRDMLVVAPFSLLGGDISLGDLAKGELRGRRDFGLGRLAAIFHWIRRKRRAFWCAVGKVAGGAGWLRRPSTGRRHRRASRPWPSPRPRCQFRHFAPPRPAIYVRCYDQCYDVTGIMAYR